MAHGPCLQQRALERFGRRHIGFGRALAHGDPNAGTGEVGPVGHHLAPLDEFVDRRAVGQEDVDGFAAVEAGDQRAGRGIARANGVAVRRSKGGSNSSVAVLIAVEMNALISAAWAAAVPASRTVTIATVRMKIPPSVRTYVRLRTNCVSSWARATARGVRN